jgi:hypothetical protein
MNWRFLRTPFRVRRQTNGSELVSKGVRYPSPIINHCAEVPDLGQRIARTTVFSASLTSSVQTLNT